MTILELSTRWGGRGTLASLGASLGAALERLLSTVALWHQRARQRRHLLTLEDRLYRDIGVTAGDVYRESRSGVQRERKSANAASVRTRDAFVSALARIAWQWIDKDRMKRVGLGIGLNLTYFLRVMNGPNHGPTH